VGNNEYLFRT
jgi:hypothetical protein